MNKKDPKKILQDVYEKAIKEIERDSGKSFLTALKNEQQRWLKIIANKSESLKAVVTALASSLVKKIQDPRQDVRYHKEELKKGYSGRSFDTKYVTPFFKEKFQRLSMKESGWLTRSIEQPHPFTLEFPGKIRDEKVKESFLQILNDVEKQNANPEKYLIGLFILIIQATTTPKAGKTFAVSLEKITIDKIIRNLKLHFFEKYSVSGASRLPVVAVYSIYEILMEDVLRYKGKKLNALRSHISPDVRAKGIGDIEVIDEKKDFFEAVEIKHNIAITSIIINDAYEKFKNSPILRYYLLTTAEPNVKSGEENNVITEIEKIKKEHGCEVIVNGIIPSLRYYLRLLPRPEKFIENYTKNLRNEFSKTTEIKKEHIAKWGKLLSALKDRL